MRWIPAKGGHFLRRTHLLTINESVLKFRIIYFILWFSITRYSCCSHHSIHFSITKFKLKLKITSQLFWVSWRALQSTFHFGLNSKITINCTCKTFKLGAIFFPAGWMKNHTRMQMRQATALNINDIFFSVMFKRAATEVFRSLENTFSRQCGQTDYASNH